MWKGVNDTSTFRSLVYICDTVILQLVALLKSTCDTRTSLLFRAKFTCKELESFSAILRFLILALQHVGVMIFVRSFRFLSSLDICRAIRSSRLCKETTLVTTEC